MNATAKNAIERIESTGLVEVTETEIKRYGKPDPTAGYRYTVSDSFTGLPLDGPLTAAELEVYARGFVASQTAMDHLTTEPGL